MSLLFCLFTFVINLWHQKLSHQTSLQCLSTRHVVVQRREQVLKNTQIYAACTVTRLEELKSVHLKLNLFAFSSMSVEYLQKIEFLISQGSLATCIRRGGYCCMSFIENFLPIGVSVHPHFSTLRRQKKYGK